MCPQRVDIGFRSELKFSRQIGQVEGNAFSFDLSEGSPGTEMALCKESSRLMTSSKIATLADGFIDRSSAVFLKWIRNM